MDARVEEVVGVLRSLGSERNVEGMRRLGITSRAEILGVSKPRLRELAKRIGVNRELAIMLWRTNIHEARILATMIADPKKLEDEVLEEWLASVDNWDLCDQLVLNLPWKVRNAFEKAVKWCRSSEEFTKRAGYALLARLVWRNRIGRKEIEEVTPLIIDGAKDERQYVHKAVAWLIKWIAKRRDLRDIATQLLSEVSALGTEGSRFIVREVRKYIRGTDQS